MSDEQLPNWSLPSNYSLVRKIGKGAFSQVYVARDSNQPNDILAIKNIKNIFENIQKGKQLLREIYIMHQLSHPNIMQIRDLVVPRTPGQDYEDIYIVMDCCQTDLRKVFHSPMFLDHDQIKFIIYQALCGVRYLHSANILHRDLKPANLLINADCSLKICDFGLSRSYRLLSTISESGEFPEITEQDTQVEQVGGITIRKLKSSRHKAPKLTKRVVTRWYRAPEVILMEQEYDKSVDIWSLGCIFAELLGMIQENKPNYQDRKPIFPGKSCFPLSPELNTPINEAGFPISDYDQLKIIINIIGTPSGEALDFITDEKAMAYVQSFSHTEKVPFTTLFPGSTAEELQILDSMIQFNPRLRASLDELLQNPYFDSVRQAEREVQASNPLELAWDFYPDISCDDLKTIFRNEVENHFAGSAV